LWVHEFKFVKDSKTKGKSSDCPAGYFLALGLLLSWTIWNVFPDLVLSGSYLRMFTNCLLLELE